MKKYFDELKEILDEDMPNMPKKAIYAFVGALNAYMEMGFVDAKEWRLLLDALYENKYITKEDFAEIVDYGL